MADKFKDTKIAILGEEWEILYRTPMEDKILEYTMGYADTTVRKIVICLPPQDEIGDVADKEATVKRVLRHEIVHAVIHESGLGAEVEWAEDESLVDFIALQYPKLSKIFKALDIE